MRSPAVLAVLAFLCFPAVLPSQELPDAPKPKAHAMFNDRVAWRDRAIWSGVGGFDIWQGCRNLSRGGSEDWLPASDCKGLLLSSLVFVAGVETLSYMFHKTGHHRLERWPRRIAAITNGVTVIRSKQIGAW